MKIAYITTDKIDQTKIDLLTSLGHEVIVVKDDFSVLKGQDFSAVWIDEYYKGDKL